LGRTRAGSAEVKRFSSLNFLLRAEAEGDWYGCIHGPFRFALAKTGGVQGTGHVHAGNLLAKRVALTRDCR
jgi:hypothetical protein